MYHESEQRGIHAEELHAEQEGPQRTRYSERGAAAHTRSTEAIEQEEARYAMEYNSLSL